MKKMRNKLPTPTKEMKYNLENHHITEPTTITTTKTNNIS